MTLVDLSCVVFSDLDRLKDPSSRKLSMALGVIACNHTTDHSVMFLELEWLIRDSDLGNMIIAC